MMGALWWLTGLSLVGVVLNIKKRRECFILWTLTNGAWCWVDLRAGLHEQAALFFVYFLLAIWGVWEWGRKPKE